MLGVLNGIHEAFDHSALLDDHSLAMGSTWQVIAEDMRYAKDTVLLKPDGSGDIVKRGPVIYRVQNKNTIVDLARKEMLSDIFGFGTIASFLAGSVGNDGSNPTDATRDRLVFELLGNAPNRMGITDTGLNPLDATDIISEVSGSNRWKIIAQYVFDTTDGNNGQIFAEYGIHSSMSTPGSPTGLSGVMFARFVPTSSFTKTSAFKVTVLWTLRA